MNTTTNPLAEFPPHWRAVSGEEAAALVRQLQAEIARGHSLHGSAVKAIARSARNDDVLFQLEDGRVAEVHLTWSGRRERPPWPVCEIYSSAEDWFQHARRGKAE